MSFRPMRGTVPIDRLPNEILEGIFRMACLSPQFNVGLVISILAPQRGHIRCVCRRWNSLVLRYPLLWNYLRTSLTCMCRSTTREYRLLDFLLSIRRAESRPVHIYHEGEEIDSIIKTELSTMSSRVCSLYIDKTSRASIIKFLFLFDIRALVNLRHLCIHSSEPHTEEDFMTLPDFAILLSYSALETISLAYAPIPIQIQAPLPVLRSFRVTMHTPVTLELINALRNMPKLRVLSIETAPSLRTVSATGLDEITLIPLHCLQILSIEADYYNTQIILSHLVARHLLSLTLFLYEPSRNQTAERFSRQVLSPFARGHRFQFPECRWLRIMGSRRKGRLSFFAAPSRAVAAAGRGDDDTFNMFIAASRARYTNQMTRRILRTFLRDIEVLDARSCEANGRRPLGLPMKWWKVVLRSLPHLQNVLVDAESEDHDVVLEATDSLAGRRWAPAVDYTEHHEADPDAHSGWGNFKGWVDICLRRPFRAT
ncbi:hypothetical protein CYLTODRAFT_447713 [Cylindrobasidium torrendii FP15055 ss-10]|uniref:Uncharacterized protein n=1 Tax=Cylindrobasidium torrendii FP15055 ss-10 TaxID=1314674 RepID=A0A0D7AU94_9AGAR|nr:hypothetical protein CYLTODRAFT_447713 [Cylindrobasidium torrendii FP15055 ss-10]